MTILDRPRFDAACATLETGFDISQTSGRRTQARNRFVGGHPQSYHLLGLARDYVFDEADPETMDLFIRRARELGIKALDEDDHFHLQPLRPAPEKTEPEPDFERESNVELPNVDLRISSKLMAKRFAVTQDMPRQVSSLAVVAAEQLHLAFTWTPGPEVDTRTGLFELTGGAQKGPSWKNLFGFLNRKHQKVILRAGRNIGASDKAVASRPWSPTEGQIYTIKYVVDIFAGMARLYVDGDEALFLEDLPGPRSPYTGLIYLARGFEHDPKAGEGPQYGSTFGPAALGWS